MTAFLNATSRRRTSEDVNRDRTSRQGINLSATYSDTAKNSESSSQRRPTAVRRKFLHVLPEWLNVRHPSESWDDESVALDFLKKMSASSCVLRFF
jgi:hypothetical protein